MHPGFGHGLSFYLSFCHSRLTWRQESGILSFPPLSLSHSQWELTSARDQFRTFQGIQYLLPLLLQWRVAWVMAGDGRGPVCFCDRCCCLLLDTKLMADAGGHLPPLLLFLSHQQLPFARIYGWGGRLVSSQKNMRQTAPVVWCLGTAKWVL